MKTYLCYDLKGIQNYIFQIPKLKCIIGGSRQIDEFDHEMSSIADGLGTLIFAGGGKGAFFCNSEADAQKLEAILLQRARHSALTICFSSGTDYSQVATQIDRSFYFVPEDLAGEPCVLSGLYPTTSPDGISPYILTKRDKGRTNNTLEQKLLARLKEDLQQDFDFFSDVDPSTPEGLKGAEALGNRNRWAVVCMDGNDMGEQFRQYKKVPHSDSEWETWLGKMSRELNDCTVEAAYQGIREIAVREKKDHPDDNVILLPIRPLIIGGDDVTLLVACRDAFPLVEKIMQVFHENSLKCEKECFPGTGGSLTISAGVLFAPTGLPLSNAIEYTEALLASAKSRGRKAKKPLSPAPEAIDWESVTDGLLDSPHNRRQRELIFTDDALGKTVKLTRRPYLVSDFQALKSLAQELAGLPRSTRHMIHGELYQPFNPRLAFYARIGKNYPDLFSKLHETPDRKTRGTAWRVEDDTISTDIVDALLLLEENDRMEQNTVFPKDN